MKRNRFVAPETCKLELSDGDWIEIKKQLSVGDDRRYRSAGLKRLTGAPGSNAASVDVDWAELALARVTTYLIDWSFTDANGKSINVSPQAIQELQPDDFEEIDAVIVKHIEEMTAEKKANAGSPTPASV
jgi:hypothetical protein